MKRLRRIHPLYYLALVLFIAALVASAVTADSSGGGGRSASVYDAGPGGTAALRTYLDAMAPEGKGSLIVVGSVAPFLTFDLGVASNGRFALALAAPAIASGRKVAFDEYHHGIHPTTDVLVLLTRTWPGRALMFVAIAFFLYLVARGRRLGPSIPLDP